MRYKLIIFDFDGTLADSFPFFVSTLDRLAERHGFKRVNSEELEMLRAYDFRQLMKHIGLPLWKLPMVTKDFNGLMAREIGRISLFEGAGDLLRALSEKGITLALVSSNAYENVRRVLGDGNGDMIRYYECGASIFGKPARLKKVLRKSGIPAAEAMCIGDEIRDLEAARRVHVAFGAVAWGYARYRCIEGARTGRGIHGHGRDRGTDRLIRHEKDGQRIGPIPKESMINERRYLLRV